MKNDSSPWQLGRRCRITVRHVQYVVLKSSYYLFVKTCDKTDSETYSVIVDTDTFDVGLPLRGVSLLIKVGTGKKLKLTEVLEIPLFSFVVLNNKITG